MSKKNQIDELFRKGLEHDGLKYTQNHWTEMEKLIEANHQGFYARNRWYLASVALLLLICAGILFYDGLNDDHPDEITQSNHEPVNQDRTQADPGSELPVNNGLTLNQQGQTASTTKDPDQQVHPQPTTSPGAATPQAGQPAGDPNTGAFNAESAENESGDPNQNEPTPVELDQPEPIEMNEPEPVAMGQPEPAERPVDPASDGEMPSPGSDEVLAHTRQELLLMDPKIKVSFAAIPVAFTPSPEKIATDYNNRKIGTPGLRPSLYVNPYLNYSSYKHKVTGPENAWKGKYEEPLNRKGFGVDLRISKKNFSLVSGLGVMQFTEQTNYVEEVNHYTFDTSIHLVNRNYLKRPDGSYIALLETRIDTTSVNTTESVPCKDCVTRFTYINIPLAIQYNLGNGKVTGFGEAGLMFSFVRKVQGLYSTEAMAGEQEYAMVSGQADRSAFNPMMLGLQSSIGIKYHPWDLLSVNARLEYQRALNSMMRYYDQYPEFIGFRIGVEWKFYGP